MIHILSADDHAMKDFFYADLARTETFLACWYRICGNSPRHFDIGNINVVKWYQ